MAQPLLTGIAQAQVRQGTPPKPLPAGAVTHDWKSFLGPTHNAMSTETKLLRAPGRGRTEACLGNEEGNRL